MGSLIDTLGADYFDVDGELVQSSIFGNGEKRTIFKRIKGRVETEVLYFDSFGKSVDDKLFIFVARTDEPTENGLCPNYSERREVDSAGHIERDVETCADGMRRSTTTREFGKTGKLFRVLREDIKLRTWEDVYSYDTLGNITDYNFVVNDLKRPKYWHLINYVDFKFDKNKNLIRAVATSSNSTRPGQMIYQFVEEFIITYYPS